jgi:hypothetical protein
MRSSSSSVQALTSEWKSGEINVGSDRLFLRHRVGDESRSCLLPQTTPAVRGRNVIIRYTQGPLYSLDLIRVQSACLTRIGFISCAEYGSDVADATLECTMARCQRLGVCMISITEDPMRVTCRLKVSRHPFDHSD